MSELLSKYVYILAWVYLAALSAANPINHTYEDHAKHLASKDVGQDLDSVPLISLRRSPHDLQHSSRALRKRASNTNFAKSPSNASEPSRQYKSSYTILRTTGASFLAPISIGGQSFLHVLDTGSSDTWVASSSFTCRNLLTGKQIPQKYCYFGSTYDAASSDGRYQQIPDQNFNITYGGGEVLTGSVGTVDITIADITVPKQQISLVDQAAWQGDGLTSGIVGLGYPALTAAYPGTDPRADQYCGPGVAKSRCNQIVYSSLIDNVFFGAKLTKPIFALALSRDESGRGDGGYLTIGGIPQLSVIGVDQQDGFARTPIRVLPGDDQFRYYLIMIEGLGMLPAGSAIPGGGGTSSRNKTSVHGSTSNSTAVNSTVHTSSGPSNNTLHVPPPIKGETNTVPGSEYQDYIIDSGTTLSFIPDSLAQRFNSMFLPPGRIDRYSGFYLVECNAQAPLLGVKIGGKIFWHNNKDLLKQYGWSGQTCISGIQSSNALGGGINILGDVFLDSVLAVFDLGAGELRFAARRDYVS